MIDDSNILNTESSVTITGEQIKIHIEYVPVRHYLLLKNLKKILLKTGVGKILLKE